VKRNESGEKSGEYDEKVKEKKRANSIRLVASSSVKAKKPACVVLCREKRECGCGEKRRQKRSEG
jgi:hypothetical protein